MSPRNQRVQNKVELMDVSQPRFSTMQVDTSQLSYHKQKNNMNMKTHAIEASIRHFREGEEKVTSDLNQH
jgi:hypothetical protein